MKSKTFYSKIYTDKYFQNLTSKERIVFEMYIFNEKVNWFGCYELTDKTSLFYLPLDITLEELRTIKNKFHNDKKILFNQDWVLFLNNDKILENKELNKRAKKQYHDLPYEIQNWFSESKPWEIIKQ